jgi:L-fucose mutarotase
MLKGIPAILSPQLLKILMEMGHGDELVLGDGNFPAESTGRRVVRCDGHDCVTLLKAILLLFPLDTFVDKPLACMAVVPGDPTRPVIWDQFRAIAADAAGSAQAPQIEFMERFAFYERARNAYAVVATGERALYANIILKKGVIPDSGVH